MRKQYYVAFVAVGIALFTAVFALTFARLAHGQDGMMCWKQSDCIVPGYVCIKRHDFDPNGVCVKGGLP